MAGDSYSFIISDFQERNIGRYAITAENQHGKATCSAKIVFEGTDFSEIADEPVQDVASSSDAAYIEETLSAVKQNTKLFSSITSEKSVSIDTVPVTAKRESSVQPMVVIPQTKDTGIQIRTDVIDNSSQIEAVKTRDESSQSEFATRVLNVAVESVAPFVTTTSESRISSKSVEQTTSSSNVTRNFSYSQQQQQNIGFSTSSSSTSGMIGASSSLSSRNTIVPNNVASSDFSTTLIKDINQHYEPVELILNHPHHHQVHAAATTAASSSTYIKEVDDFQHHLHQRQQLNRFEPVNLIFPRPFYGMGRSGSLPPVVSRVNYKASTRSDFEQTDTEDDSAFYYQADQNKENYASVTAATTYYKGIERKARPQFKPVELVLDAASLSDSGQQQKRYRDNSYPTTLQSKRIRTPVTSSFIYDNSNEYDSSTSDFISDETRFKQQQQQQQTTTIRSTVSATMEDKETKGLAVKLPCMEMTIDLKAPPTIEVPLKNVHSAEGQFVKLECIVNGN